MNVPFWSLPPAVWMQLGLYFLLLFAAVVPLGHYMARVYRGQTTVFSILMRPLETFIYRLAGPSARQEMSWKTYAKAAVLFNLFGMIWLAAILAAQGVLPLNPQHMPGLSWHLALNIAVSFVTNTDWQSYAGEQTLSYFSQMAGLGVQNFLSAGTGMAVLIAVVRGIASKNTQTLGNFWVDLTRSVLYILLPLSLCLAILLNWQGVPQTLKPSVTYEGLQNQGSRIQEESTIFRESQDPKPEPSLIARGPVASQVAIKQLGSNGGGFFNTNSAHPLENPTPLTNLLQMLAILLIPAALCYTFGMLVEDQRQGWAILAAMALIFLPLALGCVMAEQHGTPRLPAEVNQNASEMQPGGNMEGKETRFGIVNSALWAAATTAASNGSVNSAHSTMTPLGSLVPLMLMQMGEVIFGGVGSGLYGMLIFVVITVFIAGLMVGRTPEYLGKKIQAFEIKMASLAILAPPLAVLLGTALAVLAPSGLAGLLNTGAAGFSEILYAFTSAANNNGSAFAGLSAGSPFYNVLLAVAMLIGRYFVLVPVLAIAGSLAAKNTVPPSAGTLPTHTPLFVFFLMAILVLVGLLTYLPALALGPAIEHLHLFGGAA